MEKAEIPSHYRHRPVWYNFDKVIPLRYCIVKHHFQDHRFCFIGNIAVGYILPVQQIQTHYRR